MFFIILSLFLLIDIYRSGSIDRHFFALVKLVYEALIDLFKFSTVGGFQNHFYSIGFVLIFKLVIRDHLIDEKADSVAGHALTLQIHCQFCCLADQRPRTSIISYRKGELCFFEFTFLDLFYFYTKFKFAVNLGFDIDPRTAVSSK